MCVHGVYGWVCVFVCVCVCVHGVCVVCVCMVCVCVCIVCVCVCEHSSLTLLITTGHWTVSNHHGHHLTDIGVHSGNSIGSSRALAFICACLLVSLISVLFPG